MYICIYIYIYICGRKQREDKRVECRAEELFQVRLATCRVLEIATVRGRAWYKVWDAPVLGLYVTVSGDRSRRASNRSFF